MFCTKCGSEVKEGAQFCTTCGQPMGSAVAGTVAAAMKVAAAPVTKKGKRIWFAAIAAILIIAALVLFLVFRGGSDHIFSAYEGTWTHSMENTSFYPDTGRGYTTLEINDDSVVFRGQYQEYLRYEGMSTEQFTLPVDEFQYYGNSGVKYLDGQPVYSKKTGGFLPVESYEYYYYTIHDLGLAFCKLSNGETVIRLFVNTQGDWEITADGIGVLYSYKESDNPAEWLYAVDFSR